MLSTPKSITPDDLQPTKLQAVLVHGIRLWVYHVPAFVHGTANMVISTIHRTLQEIPAEKRADKLYLQLDGASNNKCKAVLAYCCWLVNQKVFKQIKISFLIVGHTHEDCDQCFSVISRRLKANPAYTVSDLKREVLSAFKKESWDGNQFLPASIVVHWRDHEQNWDVSSWLLPHVDPSFSNFRYTANCFQVAHYMDGVVRLHYKKYASHAYWKPVLWDEQGDACLHPPGHPKAGNPIQDTSKIVIMSSYPSSSSFPMWEAADRSWLLERSLAERNTVLTGPKFQFLIPRPLWSEYVRQWNEWYHHARCAIDGLVGGTRPESDMDWHLPPLEDMLLASVQVAESESSFSQAAISSGLGEAITFTGHTLARERKKREGRVYNRTAKAIQDGSLLALKKVISVHELKCSTAFSCEYRMKVSNGTQHLVWRYLCG
jgi:hypothetical protein